MKSFYLLSLSPAKGYVSSVFSLKETLFHEGLVYVWGVPFLFPLFCWQRVPPIRTLKSLFQESPPVALQSWCIHDYAWKILVHHPEAWRNFWQTTYDKSLLWEPIPIPERTEFALCIAYTKTSHKMRSLLSSLPLNEEVWYKKTLELFQVDLYAAQRSTKQYLWQDPFFAPVLQACGGKKTHTEMAFTLLETCKVGSCLRDQKGDATC